MIKAAKKALFIGCSLSSYPTSDALPQRLRFNLNFATFVKYDQYLRVA
jgi:hypothetical protein